MGLNRIVRVAVKDACYRIIPTKYPTVHVFDDVAAVGDFDALYQLQALTNPRLSSSTGPSSNYINAPFAHLNPEGSRFSDGLFGIYYAGCNEAVCIAETKHHTAKFLNETREPAQELDMRMIVAHLSARLHNLSGKQKIFPQYYHKTNYHASQVFGSDLYDQGADGIRYSSVRHKDHDDAYAVFNKQVLSRVRQLKYLVYVWDSASISDIYEKKLIES